MGGVFFFSFCSQNNSFSGVENNIELNISLGEHTPGTHKELNVEREEGLRIGKEDLPTKNNTHPWKRTYKIQRS